MTTVHTFHALAFIENFSLKELAVNFPEAKRARHQLSYPAAAGGTVFLFSFGVVIFCDVGQAGREGELLRLRRVPNGMRDAQVISEEFRVREMDDASAAARPDVEEGVLVVDRLTPERTSMVALTVAQSAAMEYYESIVDQMFADTDHFVARLEKSGNISVFTAKLQRFIGAAISTRSEVISVLHLLDKPDVVWDDVGAERIYEELRSEFDLVDRYQSLELKLRSVQESLSLLTDIARDRRLVLLEASVIALILLEIVLSLVRH
ncbi:MAG: RMD1 family protein [Myxococcales bacterium]